MIIETKYGINRKVWVVIENETKGTTEVFTDEIAYITYDGETVSYYMKTVDEEFLEEDLVPIENTQELLDKIKQVDKQVIKRYKEN